MDLCADTLFYADKNEVDWSMLPDGQDLLQEKNVYKAQRQQEHLGDPAS